MSKYLTPQQPSDEIIKALLEAFTYDPESGDILWNLDRPREHFMTDRGHKRWLSIVKKNAVAGSINGQGYRIIKFSHPLLEKMKSYKAYHLAWLLHHKVWPLSCLDHINGDRADNRISNLRLVSHRQNHHNRKNQSKLGIGAYPNRNGYQVSIYLFGASYYIGTYKTPDIATTVYDCVHLSFVMNLDEGPNGLSRADLEDAIASIPSLKEKIEQIREENSGLSRAA